MVPNLENSQKLNESLLSGDTTSALSNGGYKFLETARMTENKIGIVGLLRSAHLSRHW